MAGHVIMHLKFEDNIYPVLLDIDDYVNLTGKKIYLRMINLKYLEVSVEGKSLSRLVLGYKGPLHVDHKSRNSLDNRKSNLRLATPEQNNRNRSGHGNAKHSKYKGVTKTTNPPSLKKPWRARLEMNGIEFSKRFETELEAALYYDVLATKYFQEFAYLNFPKKKTETENGT